MRLGRRIRTALVVGMCLGGPVSGAWAQGGLDRTFLYLVKGEVRDEFGDPIKGATVTALNDAQGTTFTGTRSSIAICAVSCSNDEHRTTSQFPPAHSGARTAWPR